MVERAAGQAIIPFHAKIFTFSEAAAPRLVSDVEAKECLTTFGDERGG